MARRRAGKKIDYTHWTGGAFSFAAIGAGSSAILVGSALHEPETLLRTRGNLLAYVDAVSTPGLQVQIAVGMILVPEGTGATVLWSPITDSDAPWFWVSNFILGYEEYVTDVIDAVGAPVFRDLIDSKAMRIIRNQEIQVVMENQTLLGAGAVNVAGAVRFLSGT